MAETKKLVLGVKDVEDYLDDDDELPTEPMTLNMGPSHPAMHGTVRIILTVEGETVKDADVQVGYLHRCFEKESEAATYTQVFPYTDRLNYVSPMLNNVGYAIAVEKLLGIDKGIPERAQYIRVIVGEMSRITDHLTCVGASGMELGAFTPFLYLAFSKDGGSSQMARRGPTPPPDLPANLRTAFFNTAAQILLRPSPPADQDNRVFLQIVTDAGDVSRHLNAVG